MWNKWKESEFFKKLKQVRVNRAVYLSAIVILLALAVVLAITAATNRARKNKVEEPPAISGSDDNTETPSPDTSGNHPDAAPTGKDEVIPEFVLPVSGSLLKAHNVDVQVFSQTMKDFRVHLGVDIATAESAPVCAAADGTVSQLWEDPMMGWCVALSHSGDCVTVYKNLAKDLAEGLTVGTEVSKGQLIGYVGDTALVEIAEEPHLHMEMTVKGLQVNPLEYFSSAVIAALTEDAVYEGNPAK